MIRTKNFPQLSGRATHWGTTKLKETAGNKDVMKLQLLFWGSFVFCEGTIMGETQQSF